MDNNHLPIPYITVEGSNFERGLQHGKEASQLIKKNIVSCYEICKHFTSCTKEEIYNSINSFKHSIKKYDCALFEELQGISRGADVSFDDIILLNAQSEVMNPAWLKAGISKGCTSFIISNEKSENGRVLMAQTWDWMRFVQNGIILLHSKEGSHEFITITEAGIIGNIGFNNKGLGVLLNYISILDINTKGTPYHLLLRRALDSVNIVDVQRNMLRSPIAFSLNIMLADDLNHAMNYELTSIGSDFLLPNDGFLAHTNHILSEKIKVRSFNLLGYHNSLDRLNRINEFICGRKRVSSADIINFFSDDDTVIVGKGNKDPFKLETLYWVIMNPSECTMLFSIDNQNIFKIDMNGCFENISMKEE